MSEIPFKPKNIPDEKAAQKSFRDFITTIAALRDKEHGCPWDLQQNHESLRRFMVEEAYEAVDAMTEGDPIDICEELGDVLLQVVLNAQLAYDDGSFSIVDVINSVNNKMRRRHPHVFGTEEERKKRTINDIKSKWKSIKEIEKKNQTKKSVDGIFNRENIENVTPSTRQAYMIGKIAKKINFDWSHRDEVFRQLLSEVDELKVEWEQIKKTSKWEDAQSLFEEIGDVYFTLGQLCRHLKQDPEIIAWDGNKKFLKRFSKVESLAAHKNIDIAQADYETLEQLWQEAKKGRE
ncbi:MAG: nucleoside triphosphate pyrophosphohydrolase [Bdellovibrionota bacterium]